MHMYMHMYMYMNIGIALPTHVRVSIPGIVPSLLSYLGGLVGRAPAM